MSLLETIVGLVLFGLLSAVVFGVFFQGMRAFRTSDTQRDLLEGGRVVLSQLDQAIQESSYSSLTIGANALSVLSAVDAQGQYALGPAGQPVWQKFLVFFRTPTGELRRAEVPCPTPDATAQPIEAWLGHPQTHYQNGGRLLAGHLNSFTAGVPSGSRRVDYGWEVLYERGGGMAPIRFRLAGSSRFRNP